MKSHTRLLSEIWRAYYMDMSNWYRFTVQVDKILVVREVSSPESNPRIMRKILNGRKLNIAKGTRMERECFPAMNIYWPTIIFPHNILILLAPFKYLNFYLEWIWKLTWIIKYTRNIKRLKERERDPDSLI